MRSNAGPMRVNTLCQGFAATIQGAMKKHYSLLIMHPISMDFGRKNSSNPPKNSIVHPNPYSILYNYDSKNHDLYTSKTRKGGGYAW